MAHTRDPSRSASQSGSAETVRAQLAIQPHPDSNCAVVEAGESRDVTHHLKTDCSDPEKGCRECHTELGLAEDETRAYLTSDVHAKCICPVFESHDCIPEIRAVRSGTIIVSVTVPRREELREILAELGAVGATVSVEWVVNGDDPDAITEFDASAITEKQREAMELAREMGYYERPRRADLGDLADELGVSKSAVSQRLNAAETKLVTAFLDE